MTDSDTILRRPGSKRHRAESRFRAYGMISIAISLSFLLVMIGSIALRGTGAFQQTFVQVEVTLPQKKLDPDGTGDPDVLWKARYGSLLKSALRDRFPDVKSRSDKKALYRLVSSTAEYTVRDQVVADPSLVGGTHKFWIRASGDVDQFLKGTIDGKVDESLRRISDKQIAWINDLQEAGQVDRRLNTQFFTGGDSREPEQAGIMGALTVIFGLLGLAIFLNVFDLPRSTPLVGGMVLALMTLPTIIIASRASLRAVPPSIREAAYGLGASKVQTTFHHVVPLAMPGMLTGTIIGMAQALGETAPLLMIGMVAFIVDIPGGFTDAATALPVQIFLWADSPERGFLEKTSAAILVLLGFLIIMNLAAIYLRRRLEVRW